MNFDLKKATILVTLAGSRAYGTHTEASDVDIKGVCIPPPEYRNGFLHNFEQADKSQNIQLFHNYLNNEEKKVADSNILEGSVYEIRKFFKLATDNNPNILDVLFCREKEIRYITPLGTKLLSHREKFLSTRCRWTFAGYAKSQLQRIETHRKWLLNPPNHQPTRQEFGLNEEVKIPKDQLNTAEAIVKKKVDSWEIDFDRLDPATKIYILNQIIKNLTEIGVTSESKYNAAARHIGYDENFLLLLQKEREYKAAKNQWDQYNNWKLSRNKKRAELEAKYGYDCYAEETEFLTNNGWKTFDSVNESDELATVYIGENYIHRNFGKIEYQKPVDKFDGYFNGELYNLYGYHTNVLVTPNHRMLIRKVERKSNKTYDWQLCEIANLPDCFEIMTSPVVNAKNYSNKNYFEDIPIKPEAFVRLMGWFISDGTCGFYKDNIKCINISQKKGGKLCQALTKFSEKYKYSANCSLYKYINHGDNNSFRKENILEYTLSVRNKKIVNAIYNDCGHGSRNKRIPRWIFNLSKRLKEILLDAAIGGDGSVRKCSYNSIVYYSSSRELASDIQELAMGCGFETSLYGPYLYEDGDCDVSMYQVHINKTAPQIKRVVRSSNIKKVPVQNKRIVCFTVPNGTLITRYKGHIGIHGNSKHALHLVRLLRMCAEILETGTVNVYRDDAKELLDIRNGKWSYDKLIGFARDEEERMDGLFKKSSLPRIPPYQEIDNLCAELVEEMNLLWNRS